MQTNTILLILIALILSVSVAFFQYFFKEKRKDKIQVVLFILKSFSLFLLLLLFINPIIKQTELQNIKPKLSLLIDDSQSISFFKEQKSMQDIIAKLADDKEINEKFDIKEFLFKSDVKLKDSVTFTGVNTNIYKGLKLVNNLYKDYVSPVVLLSDGNQTIGNDYNFINSNQNIYPVVFGDTTKYKDLKITQLNVNKYSYIKNKFPVEVLINYEGKETVSSRLNIYKKGKVVFSKRLKFSEANNSKSITTNLTSSEKGLQYYTASILKIEGEKNTKNNTKTFSVEVIDEQTKVLLLTSVLHPDIGALKKAVESNKQRSLDIFKIDDFNGQLNNYQLVVLFEVNKKFNNVINEIKKQNSNYILVSGPNSDWNFINQQQLGFQKNAINQTENFGAILNNGFLTFSQKDIGFNQFPPLLDKFGEVEISKEHQTLLYQNINGLETKQPLLVTFEENSQKTAVLFGQGIWKWRANSFLSTNSFQDFDVFIGNLIQYIASNKKRDRLEVNTERLIPANSKVILSAFYTDQNFKFDNRASLEVTITNTETQEELKSPFSLINNSYQTEIESLPSGDYQYKVAVLGQNINKYGKFKITDFLIEEQFTRANTEKLLQLADRTGGKLYHKNQFKNLKEELLTNTSYYTIQKSITKEKNLIDWRWILCIVISLFSAEWFIRKYHGKI